MPKYGQNPLKNYLHTLIRQAKSDLEKRFARAKIGITPFQYGVLLQLKSAPITLNELGRQMNLRPPSLIHPVDDLQNAKFLTRHQDTKDRRKIYLRISKKGLQLLKEIPLDDRKDSLNLAFNKLQEQKRKELLRLLKELTQNLS